MNWKIKNILLLLSILVISSCNKVEVTKSTPVNKNKDAILIYMASDNNLYPYAENNIRVMESLYDENSAKQILVYADAINGDATLRRLVTTPKGETSRSEIIKTYKRPDSSDPKVLESVINDALEVVGSNNLTDIVLWSHGKAWLPYKYSPVVSVRSFQTQNAKENNNSQYSFGVDNSAGGTEINIDKLAGVLSKYKFDNIIFDACYMSSIEVLYQLRNSASFIIASPAEVLADGFAYSVTTPIFTENKIDGVKLAKIYFDFYNSKAGSSRSATIAVIDCSKLELFATSVKSVIDKYSERIDNDNIRAMVGQYDRNSANQYYYDLKTYIAKIITTYADPFEVDAEIAAFDASYSSILLYEAHTPYMLDELSFEGTYGISGYIPDNKLWKYISNSYFKTLDWASASGLSNPSFFR